MKSLFYTLLIFYLMISAHPAAAVHSEKMKDPEKAGIKLEKPMDQLSLVAYISSIAGLAALFFAVSAGGLPAIVLMSTGFVLGLVAILSGKRRFRDRRGKGLAMAAMIVGGVIPAMLFVTFIALAL